MPNLVRQAAIRSIACLALIAPGVAMAQDAGDLREIATDRPNLTDSPTTIDAGHVQIETGGLDFSRDRSGDTVRRDYSVGDINMRVGILDSAEINIILQPSVITRIDDRATGIRSRSHGFGDVTVGGKINLWGNAGSDRRWATALAIKPQVKLPVARGALGNGRVEWAAALPFTLALPQGFGLSVQPSLLRLRDAANRRYTTGYEGAVAIDHDIGPLNAYAEYVFDDTREPGQADAQLLNLGATAAVTRNLVIDAGVGIGLNDAADGVRFLTGGSVRF